MIADPWLYGGFAAAVAALLAVDLLVTQRHPHAVSLREAAIWSAVWIGAGIAFGLLIPRLHAAGGEAMVAEYFTAYVIEKALSVDNVFLFLVIFSSLSVPRESQHRVLFYGVLGAIVMRTVFIFAGVALIERFDWLLYGFGAFLMYAGWRTWRERGDRPDVSEAPVLRAARRVLPTTDGYRGKRFVVREGGRLLATPLLLVLVLVEFTDLIFAVDSIPAVFAITRDPFIVLTSNVFAILGLRALYFLLSGVADRLRYLKAGLAVILGYVGLKLFTENIEALYHPSPLQSLAVIGVVLAVVVTASLAAGPVPERLPPTGLGPLLGPRRHADEPEEPRQ